MAKDIKETVYKAVTHALLGIITFLAARIYTTVDEIQKIVYEHGARITVIESRLK